MHCGSDSQNATSKTSCFCYTEEKCKEIAEYCISKMYLPSVVKQIGSITGENRVYIEDYVYTYLNELKKENNKFPVRVALYGHAFHKEQKRFFLIYGASCVIEELECGREQEQIQKDFFEEYTLIGYMNLYNNQELPGEKEGCYIFYEVNEPMQNYLISCYERKNKRNIQEKTAKTEKKYSFWDNLLQKVFFMLMTILAAVSVITINHYERMHEFVIMAAKAMQEIR